MGQAGDRRGNMPLDGVIFLQEGGIHGILQGPGFGTLLIQLGLAGLGLFFIFRLQLIKGL